MPRRGARTHIDVTAFHEAGHALAALREGHQLVWARVDRARPGAGRTRYRISPHKNPYNPGLCPGSAQAAWLHTLNSRLAEVRINLAGPLAEAKALGQPLRALGAYGDLIDCQLQALRLNVLWDELGRYCKLPPPDAVALVQQQRIRVRRWLGRPKTWYLVVRVADMLSRQGVIDGPALQRELARVQRPALQLDLELDGPHPVPCKRGESHRHQPPGQRGSRRRGHGESGKTGCRSRDPRLRPMTRRCGTAYQPTPRHMSFGSTP